MIECNVTTPYIPILWERNDCSTSHSRRQQLKRSEWAAVAESRCRLLLLLRPQASRSSILLSRTVNLPRGGCDSPGIWGWTEFVKSGSDTQPLVSYHPLSFRSPGTPHETKPVQAAESRTNRRAKVDVPIGSSVPLSFAKLCCKDSVTDKILSAMQQVIY